MTWKQLTKLALALPEVEESIWYRTPSLKVRGKGFIRLKEDGASVVFLLESVDEQQFLLSALPKVYFITDHYKGWPAILARLPALTAKEARQRALRTWRLKAPRAVLKAFDATRSAAAPSRRAR